MCGRECSVFRCMLPTGIVFGLALSGGKSLKFMRAHSWAWYCMRFCMGTMLMYPTVSGHKSEYKFNETNKPFRAYICLFVRTYSGGHWIRNCFFLLYTDIFIVSIYTFFLFFQFLLGCVLRYFPLLPSRHKALPQKYFTYFNSFHDTIELLHSEMELHKEKNRHILQFYYEKGQLTMMSAIGCWIVTKLAHF